MGLFGLLAYYQFKVSTPYGWLCLFKSRPPARTGINNKSSTLPRLKAPGISLHGFAAFASIFLRFLHISSP